MEVTALIEALLYLDAFWSYCVKYSTNTPVTKAVIKLLLMHTPQYENYELIDAFQLMHRGLVLLR